jgi:nucleotidyltransferase-like protein
LSAPSLPAPIAGLVERLAGLPGVVAVVLGGSRATGTHRPDSDWDLGLYHRRSLDTSGVRALGHPGHVSGLGEWGPIMDGGAWLTVDGHAVDVIYRDLDRVERWLADAREGRYEVLTQNGYLVGAPTYLPVGELALCRPLSGELPRPSGFPPALSASAARNWTGRAAVALMFASAHARGADAIACAGMLSAAVLSAAHARLAERGEWALNEKRLAARAGLDAAGPLLAAPGATADELQATVAAVADVLGIEPLTAR